MTVMGYVMEYVIRIKLQNNWYKGGHQNMWLKFVFFSKPITANGKY